MKRNFPLRRFLPPRFAWRTGNRFELLIDGEQYFPRMLAAIDQAKRTISMEMYLVASGNLFAQFRDALLRATQRGVQVRLLLDDFGSQSLRAPDRQILQRGGVELAFYNRLRWRKGLRNLFRNHRKLLLVDQQCAFVGGAGLTDDFISTATRPGWHEVMLRIDGPVIGDWQQLFDRTWLRLRERWQQPATAPIESIAAGSRGRVCASSGLRAHHVTQSLYQRIRTSQRRIWLMTPYFLPSLKLRRLLMEAARQKLDVRILVPGEHTDLPAVRQASRRHFLHLMRSGIRIHEYQPRFIHAKMALCDDWVSTGSTNFDRWNLHWNLDANQEIDDAAFASQVAQLFAADIAQSVELDHTTWENRPWRYRLREWLASALDRWLSKLS